MDRRRLLAWFYVLLIAAAMIPLALLILQFEPSPNDYVSRDHYYQVHKHYLKLFVPLASVALMSVVVFVIFAIIGPKSKD